MIVSVIIPCYRSSKTIEKVVDEIRAVFKNQNKYEYEMVLRIIHLKLYGLFVKMITI